MTSRDPAAMTAEERLADVTTFLAAGYLRALARRHISSAAPSALGESMAPCGQTVNGAEKAPEQEVTWKTV